MRAAPDSHNSEIKGVFMGAVLAVYLISKILEWAIFKRVIDHFGTMITLSTSVTVLLVAAGRWNQARLTQTADPEFGLYVIVLAAGSAALVVVRLLWQRRKVAKEKLQLKAAEAENRQ